MGCRQARTPLRAFSVRKLAEPNLTLGVIEYKTLKDLVTQARLLALDSMTADAKLKDPSASEPPHSALTHSRPFLKQIGS